MLVEVLEEPFWCLMAAIHYQLLAKVNANSTDRLHVDKIGQIHLHVDVISEQFSDIYILLKTFIFLLSYLNRLNNTWVLDICAHAQWTLV